MNPEILEYKKVSNGRDKIGEVKIKIKLAIDTIVILNKMHHAVKGDSEWVNFAAYSEVDEKGKRKFIQYLEFEDKELERRIREVAMQKLKESKKHLPLFDELPYLQEDLPF